MSSKLLVVGVATALAVACSKPVPPPVPGDAAFQTIAGNIIADHMERNPSQATDLGVHTYDAELEDFSRASFESQVKTLQGFRRELDAANPASLSADHQLDREQLLHVVDSQVLALDVIRQWTKDPDMY